MEDTTSAKQILDRLKQGTGARSDTELGHMLGLAQQSVYNARANDKIPDSWIRKAAERFNLSADWLFFGVGKMASNQTPAPATPHIDKGVLRDVIESLEGFLGEVDKDLSPEAKAEVICQLYELIVEEETAAKQPMQILRLIKGALAANG